MLVHQSSVRLIMTQLKFRSDITPWLFCCNLMKAMTRAFSRGMLRNRSRGGDKCLFGISTHHLRMFLWLIPKLNVMNSPAESPPPSACPCYTYPGSQFTFVYGLLESLNNQWFWNTTSCYITANNFLWTHCATLEVYRGPQNPTEHHMSYFNALWLVIFQWKM